MLHGALPDPHPPATAPKHAPMHPWQVQGGAGRVVVVSSSAHGFGKVVLEDLNFEKRRYGAWAR